jgi:hypothetical protein
MITNDLHKDKTPRPLVFFKNAFDALTKLLTQNIVHLDIARRNIFFDDSGALLGDFGFGIDMAVPNDAFDLGLENFLTVKGLKPGKPAHDYIDDTLAVDDTTITPEAALALYIYNNFDIRDDFFSIIPGNDDFIYAIKYITRKKTETDGYFNHGKYLAVAEEMRVADVNRIREILKRELRDSDIKMFLTSIIPVIAFDSDATKARYVEAIKNGNFGIFYELLGQEPTPEIKQNILLLQRGEVAPPRAPPGYDQSLLNRFAALRGPASPPPTAPPLSLAERLARLRQGGSRKKLRTQRKSTKSRRKRS